MSTEQKKKMSALLIGSLCLNLFLGGVFIGGGIAKYRSNDVMGPRDFAPPVRSLLSPRDLIRGAGGETRDKLKKMARENFDTVRPQLTAVHEKREALYKLLSAETLDKEAVRAAMTELADAEKDMQIVSSDFLITMLETLSAEERKRLIREGDHRKSRHHPGHWPPREERREGGKEFGNRD